MGKGPPPKEHKMVCVRLELSCPQSTKGLPSFTSVGPRLILVGSKWCFYSGGMGHMW